MDMNLIHIIALKDNKIYDLQKKIKRYEKALKEILEEPYGDAEWLEIAMRYEAIAVDALKD